MSYTTLKKALTGSTDQAYYNDIASEEVDKEIDRLGNLRDGITDHILLYNRAPMDKYISFRQAYLDSTEPDILYNNKTVKQYEWRSQLTHASTLSTFYAEHVLSDTVSAHAGTTGSFQLCSVDIFSRQGTLCSSSIYGAPGVRESTLDNWTMERWQLYDKRRNTSTWYACAAFTGDTETFNSITDATIAEAGLTGSVTVSGLQQGVADFYTGMKWIYSTPDWHFRNLTHYNDRASFGIDFLISSNLGSKDAITFIGKHYSELSDLNNRY